MMTLFQRLRRAQRQAWNRWRYRRHRSAHPKEDPGGARSLAWRYLDPQLLASAPVSRLQLTTLPLFLPSVSEYGRYLRHILKVLSSDQRYVPPQVLEQSWRSAEDFLFSAVVHEDEVLTQLQELQTLAQQVLEHYARCESSEDYASADAHNVRALSPWIHHLVLLSATLLELSHD